MDQWRKPSNRRVDLWWLSLEGVSDDSSRRWAALLDDDERARAVRFVHDRDRRPFVAAHALLRVLLQAFGGRPAAAWRLAAGRHGKPVLHPDHGQDAASLSFNISHTRGAVACATTLDHPVGVDVEALERPGDLMEIARSYFAPAELATLRATAPADRRATFLRLWTLKEAYLKARGDGLSLPLDRFAFSLSPPRVTFEPGFGDRAGDWQFHSLSAGTAHVLSLAVRHGADEPLAVQEHRLSPADLDG
ncbi:MAG: 4'-phosphopantetheinyl transferase superfamily protein [Enhydrobacter sp.]|nr:MAG: 4'-phosphopantetheinyl transferase superfamily protein [Enhydrobacter sp.]